MLQLSKVTWSALGSPGNARKTWTRADAGRVAAFCLAGFSSCWLDTTHDSVYQSKLAYYFGNFSCAS